MKTFKVKYIDNDTNLEEYMEIIAISEESIRNNFEIGNIISIRELKEDNND